MILSEFKKFINSIPDEYDDLEVSSDYDETDLVVAEVVKRRGDKYIFLRGVRGNEEEGSFID